jgi:radical SAM protein with 4Fe4S-binding SPASM domain
MYEFPELKVGSIRTSTIQELWERDELWTIYRQTITPSGKCCDCEYLYSCKTGCRILSYSAFGDMGAPDPGCSYEPAAFKNRNAACK